MAERSLLVLSITVVCAGVACVLGRPAAAAGPGVAVVVVPSFPPERYAGRGAVGLLVPGAGSTVTRAGALAALERGKVRSALLGGRPTGPALIRPSSRPADVTVYVSLPPPGRSHNVSRYPVAIVGGGYHGLLTSTATRIDGLVSVADVAPTVLALERGTAPPLRSVPAGDAAADLRRLDARLAAAHDARSVARLVVVALLLAALAAALLLGSRIAARAGLLVPPFALAAALVLSGAHEARTAAVVGAFLVAGLAALLLARRGDAALVAVVSAFLAAFLGVLAAWPALNALSVLGPHPDGGGRYYGVTNEVETLLLAPVLAAAAAAGPLLPAVAALAFAAVGWSRAGADGGGLLVLGAAFAVLAVGLLLPHARARSYVPAAAAGIALAFALVALDRATGGASHVTQAVDTGTGLVGETLHRWHVSWAGATSSWPVVVESLAGLAGLVVFGLAARRSPAVVALLAGIAVSLLVNDTPQDVLAFGALTGGSLWAWERLRPPERRTDPFTFRPRPSADVR